MARWRWSGGDRGYVSRAEETNGIEGIGGEGEERESGGERTKGQGLTMTTKGGKPNGGDTVLGVKESEEEEKKGESS